MDKYVCALFLTVGFELLNLGTHTADGDNCIIIMGLLWLFCGFVKLINIIQKRC